MAVKAEPPEGENQWASQSDWFPDDQFLRAMGFTIQARPGKGPAIWRSPRGRVLHQELALALARRAFERRTKSS